MVNDAQQAIIDNSFQKILYYPQNEPAFLTRGTIRRKEREEKVVQAEPLPSQ